LGFITLRDDAEQTKAGARLGDALVGIATGDQLGRGPEDNLVVMEAPTRGS